MKTDEAELVVVQTFDNTFSANLALDKLKENNIESFVSEDRTGLNPLGGTELKVKASDAERAKKILEAKNDKA